MDNVLPFLLIVISLSVIIVIIIRKFPQLTLLDVDSLPEVKEEKQKDAFLKKRADKLYEEKKKKQQAKMQQAASAFSNVQGKFRKYVTDVYNKGKDSVETQMKKVEPLGSAMPALLKRENTEKVKIIIDQARQALQEEKLDLAENQFISAIRLDKKNNDAYRGLVDVYIQQGQWHEAKETCSFLLQLHPQDDLAHMRMVEIAEEMNDTHVAIHHLRNAIRINSALAERHFWLSELLKKEGETAPALDAARLAVEKEAENPRYLDNLIELAIMSSNKKLAEDSYNQLRLVNPENNKLESFKQKIAAL